MATVHFVQKVDGWVDQADQRGDGKAGFGEWLRRAREARGLTLDDISRETKIPLRNIEALELGHLGGLPTFYQRAEVRAVAKAVGVDERLALGRLDSAIPRVVTLSKAESARPRIKEAVWTAASVVLALGALLLIGAERQPANESSEATASRREAAIVAPQPPVVQPASVSVDASPVVATAAVAGSPVVATAAIAVSTDEATAAVAPPPASFTELVVRTDPPGAHVTVNGIGWGPSPVTIRHLPPGEKHIRATKAGFSAAEGVLALDDNQRRALDLRLATAP